MFFKPVVHLSRLGVRKQVQTFGDELGVGFQQKRTLFGSVQMMLVLCLRHRQITFDGTAIQIQVLGYPADGPVVIVAIALDSIVHD